MFRTRQHDIETMKTSIEGNNLDPSFLPTKGTPENLMAASKSQSAINKDLNDLALLNDLEEEVETSIKSLSTYKPRNVAPYREPA